MAEIPTVYIVDDDEAARESVAAMVASKGLRVREYGSAEEFLNDFDDSLLTCLLTDVRMAGMDGLQLQKKLRAGGCSMPVIVITGYGDVPSAVNAFRAGAVTFMEKPCDARQLWDHISRALRDYRAQREKESQKRELVDRFDRLSESEREVMEAMIEGKPNKVIASELFLGLRTVELRRSNVMKKTKAQSLAELVRMCVSANACRPEKSHAEDEFGRNFH